MQTTDLTLPARTSLLLAAAALLVPALSPAPAAAQPRCEAPRVMLVVDRSSSMSASRSGRLPSGDSKWEAAYTAIAELSAGFADRVDFGLAVYPGLDGANSCDPGLVTVGVGPHTADEVLAGMPSEDPPYAGNWTPTAQTLADLDGYGPLMDGSRTRHVILITDGEQCCYAAGGSGCIAEQRFEPVERIMELRAMGISTHVIGFGAYVDALVLNRAAVAGGTARPGCDGDGIDAGSPTNCYHHADDLDSLRMALEEIARLVTDEVCDGYDNDCDGVVDDGFDVDTDNYTVCGTVPDEPGHLDPGMVDCDDSLSDVHPGAPELCDGIDNDCDGAVDPGCDCLPGDSRPCGTDIGACVAGTQTCVDGAWGMCQDETGPVDEICDGIDQDCDGVPDDGATCPGLGQCYGGVCVDPAGPDPIEKGGCACTAPGQGPLPAGGAILAMAVAGLLLRRRRG